MKSFVLLFAVVLGLTACGGGGSTTVTAPANTDSPTVAAKTSALAAGDADCPYGGILVETGVDSNKNNILDAGEVSKSQKVCNGTSGVAGTQGTTGATGATGVAGAQGTSGTNGLSALVKLTQEAAGANCLTGGVRVDSGMDASTNGMLDAGEITSTAYSCNGATGATGAAGTVDTAVDIILPRKVYAMLGSTGTAIEELNIYFPALVQASSTPITIDCIAPKGRQYEKLFRDQPGNTAISQYSTTAGTYNLEIRANSATQTLVKAQTTTVQVVSKTKASKIRFLSIGDSITRSGIYAGQIQSTLNQTSSKGIRTYDGMVTNHEGRGGWALSTYFSAGNNNGLDSPFMFPVGVSGSAYKGNAKFWSDVVGGNADYDHDGFQNIAKGWATGSFVYDASGYPLTPQDGDVVYDPSKVSGQKFQTYSGGAWGMVPIQPSNWAFDFGKYLTRYAEAFTESSVMQAPDIVTIMLGTNDFQSTDGLPGITTWLANMTTLIDSIHAYSPTIKVVVVIPPTGANQDAWGLSVGAGGTSAQYRRNMQLLGRQILTVWDTDAALAANTYVVNAGMAVDPDYGFDTTTEPANKFNPTLVTRYSNWVHPNTAGQKQLGDAIAAIIQGIR